MSELWIVDAFADAPFSGNPAAVCMLSGHRPDYWHQALAGEMNQAETAFLTRRDGDWGLRWFTPRVEVDLCGHATLASAHVLWEDGHLDPGSQARFHTKSGLLTADRRNGAIVLDFPRSFPVLALAGASGESLDLPFLFRIRVRPSSELAERRVQVRLVDDVVAIEDGTGLVPGDAHRIYEEAQPRLAALGLEAPGSQVLRRAMNLNNAVLLSWRRYRRRAAALDAYLGGFPSVARAFDQLRSATEDLDDPFTAIEPREG